MSPAYNPFYKPCPKLIGELYITMDSTEPQKIWPGTTWKQITDCMIRAADSTHPAGSTGGAWEIVQTVDQMPAHNHLAFFIGILQSAVLNASGGVYVMRSAGRTDVSGGGLSERTTGTGQTKPMSIVNKYVCFYMWQRVS